MATSPFGGGTFALDPLLQFLQRVVAWSLADPPDSYVNIHAFGGTNAMPFRGGGRAFAGAGGPSDALGFVEYLNRINAEVFFCCAAVDTYDREHSGRNLRALRKGIRPLWYRSLVLDLDTKPGRYASQREALAAWLSFCRDMGLETGPLVSTGVGIHAYIAFDQPVPAAQRSDLARRLVAAAQAHGIKADWPVTTDAVRILRVPTSFNRKDPNNPLLCRVLDLGSTMPVDAVAAALENYSPTVSAPGPASRMGNGHIDLSHLGPPPSTMPPVSPQDRERAHADRERSREATTVELVAQHCPLVERSLGWGGNTDGEPLWYAMAKLCHYLQDGRSAFHSLSRNHPDYDPQETDEKFDKVEQLGWPSCAMFEQTTSEAGVICRACRHHGEGKSPIHFGVGLTGETRRLPVTPTVNGAAAYFGDSTVPIIYRTEKAHRDAEGYIVSNTDGRQVFNVPIFDADLMYDAEGGLALRVDFDKRTSDTAVHSAEVSTGIMRVEKDFMKATAGRGLTTAHPKLAMEVMTDWVTQIQQSRQAFTRSRKGWTTVDEKITGFAFGGYIFDKTGAHRQPGRNDEAPVGTLENWQKALSVFVGKGYIELEIMIASAFAAPLMPFTQADGGVLHARSSGSGKGKSASMDMAATVWANRKSKINSTTAIGISQSITNLNNLPLYVDEMLTEGDRGAPTKNFSQLLLDVTSGTGRLRADVKGNLRPRSECCTMMVSAANVSLVRNASGRDTNAQAARVFEIVLPDIGKSIAPGDVATNRMLLAANHGVAAFEYCKVLGAKYEAIAQIVRDQLDLQERELGYHSEERCWSAICATLLVGAKIAKGMGLLPFDVAGIKQRLYAAYREQRAAMRDLSVDADNPMTQLARVGQFLNDKIRNRIITHHMPKKGNPGTAHVVNADQIYGVNEFVARYATVDGLLWVSENKLRVWCELNRYSFEEMRGVLVKHGYCTRDPKKPRTIGGGTVKFATSRELVMEFDLNLPCNEPLRLTEETDAV